MSEKTAITPAGHTTPPARFSHGVRKGGILQVAGQVGFGPAVPGQAPAPVGPGLREQTLQTLANVQAVLEEGGSSWEDVVMVRVYLVDLTPARLEMVMPHLLALFGGAQPSLTGIGVAALAVPDLQMEVEMVVRLPS